MRIIVDAMGGDNAPEEIVKGAVKAARDLGITLILTGDKDRIEKFIDIKYDKIEIVHTTQEITMHDSPMRAAKEKEDSSMMVALKMLGEGKGDAVVSAGNTGAIMAGAIKYVKRIDGVLRPALAAIIPGDKGVMLLIDGGANTNCRPQQLCQFAIMGSIYAQKVMGFDNPRVGLANIGEEDTKGNELCKGTYPLLKEMKNINFCGNVEAREIPKNGADVIVCDGFVGNMLIKFMEGVAWTFYKRVKGLFMKNIFTKLAALIVKDGISDFKKMMDYAEYGGAPFLGVDGAVIKSHGSSNAKAIYYAVIKAAKFAETGVVENIKKDIVEVSSEEI